MQRFQLTNIIYIKSSQIVIHVGQNPINPLNNGQDIPLEMFENFWGTRNNLNWTLNTILAA